MAGGAEESLARPAAAKPHGVLRSPRSPLSSRSLVSAAAALVLALAARAGAEVTRYRSDVYAPDGAAKLLDGETVQTTDAGLTRRRTVFRKGGEVVATSDVTFRTDTLRLESYTQDDLVCGNRVRVAREGDALVLRFAEKPGASEDVTRFEDPRGVLTAGSLTLDATIRQWEALERGGDVRFEMIVSEKGMHVPFVAGTPERVKVRGRDALRVRIKTSNWLLRLFAPEVVFSLDAAAPHEPLEVVAPTIVRTPSCDLVRGRTVLERQ